MYVAFGAGFVAAGFVVWGLARKLWPIKGSKP
jgi:hypothetical protein